MSDLALPEDVRTDVKNADGVIIALFDAGNHRVGYIAVLEDKCGVCHSVDRIIQMNGSEMEYGPGCICLACATKALTE